MIRPTGKPDGGRQNGYLASNWQGTTARCSWPLDGRWLTRRAMNNGVPVPPRREFAGMADAHGRHARDSDRRVERNRRPWHVDWSAGRPPGAGQPAAEKSERAGAGSAGTVEIFAGDITDDRCAERRSPAERIGGAAGPGDQQCRHWCAGPLCRVLARAAAARSWKSIFSPRPN